MRQAILVASIICLGLFALSGCSTTTTIVVVVTATPAPVTLAPTLTPLPPLPSATPVPPTSVPTQTSTITPIPSATLVLAPGVATLVTKPTQAPPPPPPPPPPQATPFLPQLSVSDQGGGNMDVYVFGGQIGKQLVLRAVACAPDCRTRPDGRDVNTVKFSVYRVNAQGEAGAQVFEHTESAAPYCLFGGSNGCDFLNISDRNVKWPGTNNVIENGDYITRVTAAGKNNASWNGRFKFRVQR